MDTITFENAMCFLVGFAVVYLMFRAMGVFLFIGVLLLVQSANAHTLEIQCVDWESTTNSGFYDSSGDAQISVPLGVSIYQLNDYWYTAISADFGDIDNTHDWCLVLTHNQGDYAGGFLLYPIAGSDYWPAVSAGITFGLVCCGFGWKLRMVKRTTSDF